MYTAEPTPDIVATSDAIGVYVDIMESHYSCSSEAPKSIPNGLVQKIIAVFKEHDYDISDNAIMRNYIAWRRGRKTGLRDEEKGIFLFTPPRIRLRFHASRLRDDFRNWQKTYVC